VVAVLCAELAGSDENTAKAAMGGFGGGLRCGEVCGAVAGGVYSLGLMYPYTDGDDLEAKRRIATLAGSFSREFRDEFGCIACRDLLKNVGREHCEDFMAYCARRVGEIAEENSERKTGIQV
jgi:C_GCAxxG_C_C family probable redox protein